MTFMSKRNPRMSLGHLPWMTTSKPSQKPSSVELHLATVMHLVSHGYGTGREASLAKLCLSAYE